MKINRWTLPLALGGCCVLVSVQGVTGQEVTAPTERGQTSSSTLRSQTRGREGLTGQQLFEHEWKSFKPPSRARQRTERSRFVAASLTGAAGRSRAGMRGMGAGDGLGPLHNAKSCADCHHGGGGAGVRHNVTLITIDPRSDVLRDRAEGGKTLTRLFPGVLAGSGLLQFTSVVHDRSTRAGYDSIRSGLADHVPGGVEESWFVPEKRRSGSIAQRPVIAGRCETIDFYLSQRNSPSLFGLGEIDRISSERLRRLAERQAAKSGGEITGRVVGKFGWRGQVTSLHEFVVGACVGELGLELESLPGGRVVQASDPADPRYANFGVDMTGEEVFKLTRFIASLPRPVERPVEGRTDAEVSLGERHFNTIGCQQCHTPDVRPISGIFSDLLLHDMGEALQAASPAPVGDLEARLMRMVSFDVDPTQRHRSGASPYPGNGGTPSRPILPVAIPIARPEQPQFPRGPIAELADGEVTWDALQREWKTPPLWGVADSAPYLHDGRAETLEEAIVWHGGEATSSREAFERLSRTDKDLVIAFLRSLRAPRATE